jgi:glycosyltransferase involved in cell wall biosynthesis
LSKHSSFPKVSIITPSFNQGKFIEDTILSVKNQAYPNIEHIIVDGGSTDNTLDILKKYEKTYNVRWISELDKGQSDAVNKGFAMTKGEIIGWLNSDDVYFDKSTIRVVVNAFLRHHNVDIIYGDIVFIDENDFILKIQCVSGFSYKRLLRGCLLEQPAVFMRRKLIEKNKLDIRLQYALDYEYWLRIGREYRFKHIPRILAADRNYADRKMVAKWHEMTIESKQVQKQYGQTFGFRYYTIRCLDKLISGIPRRLKGLIWLLTLSIKQNYTFNIKRDRLLATLKRQLFSINIITLMPKKTRKIKR